MTRNIYVTGDGSTSVHIPEWGVSYHSRHGAIRESQHIFIAAGLRAFPAGEESLRVLEVGFGAGLNALLTVIDATDTHRRIHYDTVEPFPLSGAEVRALNYIRCLGREDLQEAFLELHDCPWERAHSIGSFFELVKHRAFLEDFQLPEENDIIYFDAFDSGVQPGLWSPEIFGRLFRCLRPFGLMLTYSSKTVVRRAMEEVGFVVEKLPGPAGKREIVRALKPGL